MIKDIGIKEIPRDHIGKCHSRHQAQQRCDQGFFDMVDQPALAGLRTRHLSVPTFFLR